MTSTQESKKVCVGIDFGTTQSTATYFDIRTQSTKVITFDSGCEMYKSTLIIKDLATGEVIYGSDSIPNGQSNNFISEMKRYIGRKWYL